MASVKFLRGSLANYLAIQEKNPDSIYITTDEGGIYLGSKRLGDYILVNSIQDLPDATKVSDRALYYAAKENVLARSNGTTWVQVNAAGLTKVKYNGQDDPNGSHDYITGITVNTNASGTERYLDISTGKLEEHQTIKTMSDDIADLQTSVDALLGGDGDGGSIAEMISNAIAPVQTAVEKAQSDATSAINTNTTQATAIQELDGRVETVETGLDKEIEDREAAFNALFKDATVQTLAALEAKIATADKKGQDALDENSNQGQSIEALETRVGEVETDLENEVKAREDAFTALFKDATVQTLAALEAKISAADAKAEGAVGVNTTQQQAIEDQGTRLGDVETIVETLNGPATLKDSVKWQVADGVASILGGVDKDFDTLKEVADWIRNDTTGAAAMQIDVAQLKLDVDGLEGRMDTAEENIGKNATAIATEKTDRENAISGLVDNEATYNTFKKVGTKLTELTGTVDGNSTKLGELEDRVDAHDVTLGQHTTAIGQNTTAIAQEVTDRTNAINGLVDGETTYNTFKKVAGKLSSIDTNYEDLEDRVAANEIAIGEHTEAIAKNATDIGTNATAIATEKTARETAITNLINGETEYATLKAAGDALRDHEDRIGNLESQLEWGTF